MSEKFDVIIVGGGMVGLCLAALIKEHVRVAIIDPQSISSMPKSNDKPSSRVSAISRSSENILKHCGAWSHIPLERISVYEMMKVWEANGASEIEFSAIEMAEPNLGHIIENNVIRSALGSELGRSEQVHWFEQKITEIIRQENKVRIKLESTEFLETTLLIGADGANSFVRKQFEFNESALNYHQQALVANISTERSHQRTAWQRFLSTGPIAYLPLNDLHQCSIVWSAEDSLAQELLGLPIDLQEKRIAAALDYRLGNVKLQTELCSFPLVAKHSSHYLQERVALIGDAAHSIHPLAGQGVNLGFLDAAALAERLIELKTKQKDLGVLANLRPFERKRKGHNAFIQKSMTILNSVYKAQQPWMVVARNMGVNCLDQLPMVKRKFMQQAMGLDSELSIYSNPVEAA